MDAEDAESRRKIVESRNISTLCHFTLIENLPSIVRNGLYPRAELSKLASEGEICTHLDNLRLDGHLDATCLSITHPNYKMFWSYRRDYGESSKWCVLLLKPSIVWKKECAFFSSNAAGKQQVERNLEDQMTAQALNRMFYKAIRRDGEVIEGSERSPLLQSNETTNPQAEILVFDRIEAHYIKQISFISDEDLQLAMEALDGIAPAPNLRVNSFYFSARHDYANWRR